MRVAAWPILFLASLVVASAPLTARAQSTPERTAGVTTAANQSVEGVPPISARGPLEVGTTVFERERVISTADGQAQLLFRDGSSFTVGPNSDLVLDDFTYDASRGTGRAALSLSKGVFRFVGGALSKEGSVELTTPAAVLGVRGGIALVEVGDAGATRATLLYGDDLAVRARDGETVHIRRPGYAVTVANAGAAPSEPVRATPDDLRRGLDPLRGQPDRAGGLPTRPPPPMVVAALRAPVAVAPPPPETKQGSGSGSGSAPPPKSGQGPQAGSPASPGAGPSGGPSGGQAPATVPSPFASASGLDLHGPGAGPGPGPVSPPGGGRPGGSGQPAAAAPPPGPPAGAGAQARQRRMLVPNAP